MYFRPIPLIVFLALVLAAIAVGVWTGLAGPAYDGRTVLAVALGVLAGLVALNEHLHHLPRPIPGTDIETEH